VPERHRHHDVSSSANEVTGIISDACNSRANRGESTHLGKDGHSNSKNCCPNKLDTDGNAIRGVIRSVLGSIVENGGEEEPDSDTPLVEPDDGTTDPLGRALGLIHWNHGGDHTNTETGPGTANDEGSKRSCGGLKGDTDREDET
jgi:hypothetical protein